MSFSEPHTKCLCFLRSLVLHNDDIPAAQWWKSDGITCSSISNAVECQYSHRKGLQCLCSVPHLRRATGNAVKLILLLRLQRNTRFRSRGELGDFFYPNLKQKRKVVMENQSQMSWFGFVCKVPDVPHALMEDFWKTPWCLPAPCVLSL